MLKHILLVKFKPGTPREEIERIIAGLRGLPERIPEIRAYEVGEDILHLARSFDLAVVGRYDDVAALKRYQEHPEHVPFANALRANADQMVSVDFEE